MFGRLPQWTLLALIGASGIAAAGDQVLVAADVPSVAVAPRGPGRLPFVFPQLAYRFRIETLCADDRRPASLSLSISDTHRAFGADALSSGVLEEVTLEVPAWQLAPVIVDNFCLASGAEDARPAITPGSGGDRLTIRGAITAHASLRCVDDDGQSMRYVSEPLDVVLVCSLDDSGETSSMPSGAGPGAY